MVYTISTKTERGILTIEAASYHAAATAAMKKLTRCRGRLVAERTTGDHGKSGWWAAYRQQRDGLNSTGLEFHVM